MHVGRFGHGHFDQNISAMDISARTFRPWTFRPRKNAKGGRFGHNNKFMCVCVCMDGWMFVRLPGCMYMCVCMHLCMHACVMPYLGLAE